MSKNKILIAGLLVVAVVGYYLFFRSDTPEALTTAETTGTGTIGQELVIELNRLKALQNIGDEIFVNPSFLSFIDFTKVVVPQPLGRPNPFAPVGSSN